MYNAKTEYVRAASVSEALDLLGKNENAYLLAGGHSLIPQMKLRVANPGLLVDIGRISELKGVTVNGDSVKIGALTTHAELASSEDIPVGLSEAAGLVADPQVRNWGTIGGNVAHADPASDLPTVLVALGATLQMQSASGSRTVSARDFFTGLFETALAEGELLTSVEIPGEYPTTGSAYEKMPNPASGYAMVGAAASIKMDMGKCVSARVAVGGLTTHATRMPSVEAALVGQELNADTISAAADASTDDLTGDMLEDIHASEDYRRAMVKVYLKRALKKAADRAQA
jgi:carbon-monoxide dehydrogenase medium subunit